MSGALGITLDEDRGFESELLERARRLVLSYFEALNSQDLEALEALTSETVIYDVQPTERLLGRRELVLYLHESHAHYREHVFDIEVMVSVEGNRAAAEFTVLGIPLAEFHTNRADLPGHTYRLPGGAFFEFSGGRIVRITNCCERGRSSPAALFDPMRSP